MGARTLEARLTLRLLALAGGLVVAVGATSVVVIDNMLDTSDSDVARSAAHGAIDALQSEIAEGDSFALAATEVIDAARREGTALRITHGGESIGDESVGHGDGTCSDVEGARGDLWRACGEARGDYDVVAAISIDAHRAAVRRLWRGMFAVIAAALLLMWIAIRRALRPPIAELAAIVTWTKRTLEREEPIELPPAETLEIDQLETAFNVLVRRLLDALARERANSAHIAHELRTPLTAILAELDTVKTADEKSRATLSEIKHDVERFAEVIEAILVLSETTPKQPTTGAIVNVADVVRELAPVTAVVDAPEEALATGDERLIHLALQNLVQNAKKYGEGACELRVSRDGDKIRVTVSDDGPGLDASARKQMFERYWRGSADIEGRGLGLALVRAVAERHGGTASAESRASGKGLAVSLTLGPLVEWRETHG